MQSFAPTTNVTRWASTLHVHRPINGPTKQSIAGKPCHEPATNLPRTPRTPTTPLILRPPFVPPLFPLPPTTARRPVRTVRRTHTHAQALWSALDYNGNGFVSLAEFDSWFNAHTIAAETAAGAGPHPGARSFVFKYGRPCLIRAFNLANGIAKVKEDKGGIEASGDDFVTRPEWRMLLVAVQAALKIYRLFDIADTSDDRRVSKDEWTAQLEVINGELAYAGYTGAAMEADDFDKVDADGGGMILLDEAVFFFLKAFTTEETLLGENDEEGC